ncbi:MAG: hypothetical protein KC910_20465, partial [Candidatus Eremiobacteraeota bacterium]|nr:hypothetical protein [Candidatus Eremiobacteraeota bacterium]
KRVSKEPAVTEMSRALLGSADNRSKVRHQVIVHVNGETGEGFYATDRGLLPAEPEAIDEAMKQAGIVVACSQSTLPAGSSRPRLPAETSQAEQLPLLPSRPKARPGLPVGLVRAVYARAFGCCERCSCRGPPLAGCENDWVRQTLLLLALLLMAGCMGKSRPQFSYQQVRENLMTRIAKLQELVNETPALEARLEALKKEVPEERRPTPEQLESVWPDDHERRFGLGYPYLLEWELYSSQEQKELKNLQADLDRLAEDSKRYFQLEAQIKLWQGAKQP